jgi:hypothetical protein
MLVQKRFDIKIFNTVAISKTQIMIDIELLNTLIYAYSNFSSLSYMLIIIVQQQFIPTQNVAFGCAAKTPELAY